MAGMSLWHILFYHQDDDISPLEEALTTQVVHQLRDKGQSFSTSWGKNSADSYIKSITVFMYLHYV